MIENYSLCLNEFRKNLAALGKQFRYVGPLRCSTTGTPDRRSAARNLPVGDLDRSPLIHSYCYASAGDQPTLSASFSLNFVPFMQYAD